MEFIMGVIAVAMILGTIGGTWFESGKW